MGALIAGMVAMYFERSRPSKRPTLLGNTYFGRQEYDAAITNFTKATGINPSFSQPYNQLGYAYRFLDKFRQSQGAKAQRDVGRPAKRGASRPLPIRKRRARALPRALTMNE